MSDPAMPGNARPARPRKEPEGSSPESRRGARARQSAPAGARWKEVWAIFHEALERTPAERTSFLGEACCGDAELRREVEELLAAEAEGLPILEESPPTAPAPPNADAPRNADETAASPAPELEPALETGIVLAGRFEIVRRIDVGGMGEVYEAEDRELGRRVALKTLRAGSLGSASAMARFRREIHLAQQVTHRNVCRVFDLVRDGGLVFLSMELLRGETLAARLERAAPLALAETRRILEQIAAALEAAHAVGVVHRDLKPANVVLVEESSELRVVVTDFGLAVSAGAEEAQEASLTRTGETVGTPAYMAPEQLEGGEVGPPTDLYALGLLLYEMVTGRQPFAGGSVFSVAARRLQGPPPSPRVHRPDLDERWEAVILRCLARRASDRFQQPREVLAALDDHSVPLPTPDGARRRWIRLWPAAAAAVAAAAVLSLLWRPEVPNRRPAEPASSEAVAELATATTSSLRALHLYGEADAAIADRRSDVAAELLREAIREDPEFASAHLLLAYAVHNQARPLEEYLPHAERAMELADRVPDRERYFIRASYFGFIDDSYRMSANYEALLRLDPDHYWANNNMASLLGETAAVPYKVRAARVRPANRFASFRAAHALAIAAGRPEEADPFVERVLELETGEADRSSPYGSAWVAWARLWGAHRHWLAGELEEARDVLDRQAAGLGELGADEEIWTRQLLLRAYRTLGMPERAMEIAPPLEFRVTRQFLRGVDAFFAGDAQGAVTSLAPSGWPDQGARADLVRSPLRVAALARSGSVDEARNVLTAFRESPAVDHLLQRPARVEARMAGELMLAERRFDEAARLLEQEGFGDDVTRWEAIFEWYGSSYFLAAEALATAYRELGRDQDALAILEQAVADRERSYPNGTETWMHAKLALARLHRGLGDAGEAERLESELRDVMRLADPDFWLVRELEAEPGVGGEGEISEARLDVAAADGAPAVDKAEPGAPAAGAAGTTVSGSAEDRRWLLIADFDNRTGEEVLSGALEMALSRELSGSGVVSLVPRPRVADTLRLMGRPIDTLLNTEVAREVALRDGRIALVLSGRVERLGDVYLLGAELIEPDEAEVAASLSEEARGQSEILAAVRRLAQGLQSRLAAALPAGATEPLLPPVSTPSLEALELYARADRLWIEEMFGGADRDPAAERLLREALAEDPEFASAHLHLAWSLMRQGRPLEEYLPHAERALELAAGATPAERYFIRGSHHRFTGELEEALPQFLALLELDPSHVWAHVNVINILEQLDRGPEAMQATLRATAALPNVVHFALRVPWQLVVFAGRIEEAHEHLERGQRLAGGESDEETAQLRRAFALHRLWLEADLDGMVAGLEETIASMGSWRPDVRERIVGNTVALLLDLGMYRRAAEVAELYGEWSTRQWEQLMAWRRRDTERLREILPRDQGENPHRTSDRALWLAQVGLADEAEALLAGLVPESSPSTDTPPAPDRELGPYAMGNVLAARGTIALVRGHRQQSIVLLEEGLKRLRSLRYLGHYLTSAIVLSRAWEELGRSEQALRVLEEASAQRSRLLEGGRFYWMEVELRRAELYRSLGRVEEAESIEERLRRLCAHADPDFPILQEIERRRQAARS